MRLIQIFTSLAAASCILLGGWMVMTRADGVNTSLFGNWSPETHPVQMEWPAMYDNVDNRPTPASYKHQSPSGVPISIMMTIFNQEEMIEEIVQALLDTTVGPYEFIAIFDNCTDESERLTQHIIDRHLERHPFNNNVRSAEGLTAYRPIILTETHYETLSNNVGLRAAVYDYGVIIQDDMIMVDQGWDRHVLRPALGYDDVLAVTGRCAHNDYAGDNKEISFPDLAGPGCGDHNYDYKLGDTYSVRDIANRGPLLLDMQKARRLDFFAEEYYPFEMDDHDLCLRGYQQFGWVCGVFAVSVHAGTSYRRASDAGPVPQILRDAERTNNARTLHRHGPYLRQRMKHNEERKVVLEDW